MILLGKTVVVNLLVLLDETEMSLLSKGLSFCPTPVSIDAFSLRNLRIYILEEYVWRNIFFQMLK